ncbi:hypothetical protein D3C81_556660 [compost metagenome]
MDMESTLPQQKTEGTSQQKEPQTTCILAGNSRVAVGSGGEITTEAQLYAFEAALALAREHLDNGMPLPKLSVAFDHHGIFRLHFLGPNLSNSQKRRPRLSHLHESIQPIFRPIADRYCIPLADIHAIHEDSARQHLTHLLATEEIPERLSRRMLTNTPSPLDGNSLIDEAAKVTCAAITKEYFERAAADSQSSNVLLEVFYQDSAWSETLAYVRGLQLSHLLGVSASIRLNLVSETGTVSQGQEVLPAHQPT